jgi:phosphoesterase RecJ-like protein
MLERHDVTLDEVEGLIDILRRTTEAEVTCVLKEERSGAFRVSLRSLGDVDVRAIASIHGGGGHRFAAGFESTLDVDDLVAQIRDAL